MSERSPFQHEYFRAPSEGAVEEIYHNPNIHAPFNPQELVTFLDKNPEQTTAPEKSFSALRTLNYHHRSADFGINTTMHEWLPPESGVGEKIHQVYRQVDLKGVGFLFPETFESRKDNIPMGSLEGAGEVEFTPNMQDAYMRYDMLGLVDERQALQSRDMGERLARAGARTEAVAGIYRLKKVWLNGRETDVGELRAAGAEKLKELAEPIFGSDEAKQYDKKRKDLRANYNPAVVVRLMRSIFRLRDWVDASADERLAMMREACGNVNAEQQALGGETKFDADTEVGREQWVQFVGFWLGKNVGITHGQGLVHSYLHMGNLTLAGEMVDLDSVREVVSVGGKKKAEQSPIGKPLPDDRQFAFIDADEFGKFAAPSGEAGQQGLPKCLIKDFRDVCFSLKMFLQNSRDLFSNFDRKKLGDAVVLGYTEGLGGHDSFATIGYSRSKPTRKCY